MKLSFIQLALMALVVMFTTTSWAQDADESPEEPVEVDAEGPRGSQQNLSPEQMEQVG